MMDKRFDQPVNRQGIGNMKANMFQPYAADPLMLNLSGAEMDFGTAPVIRERLQAVAAQGLYGFTLPDAKYLTAVSDWFEATRHVTVSPKQVVVTAGTTSALNTALRAFTAIGDDVVIQAPSYYRFDRAIRNNERHVVYNQLVSQDDRYVLDLKQLAVLLARPSVTMLVLVNPHNPTGAVFTRDSLQAVARLAEANGVVVFADEIFGELQFQAPPVSYAQVTSHNALISTSLGKSFNFTGVNQANLVIEDEQLRAQFVTQRDRDHFGSIDPFFYNALLAAYTPAGADWLAGVCNYVQENHQLLQQELANTPLQLAALQGGFMAWVDCRKLTLTDAQLARFMRDWAHVLGDPGTDYGESGRGFFRFNLATPRTHIQQLAVQLKAACQRLVKGERP